MSLSASDSQHRARRGAHDLLRRGSEQREPHTTATLGAHDDEVDLQCPGGLEDLAIGSAGHNDVLRVASSPGLLGEQGLQPGVGS